LAVAGFLAGAAFFTVPFPPVVLAAVAVLFLAALFVLDLGFAVALAFAGTLFLAAAVYTELEY
jgi:threonine/homoserine efflux transporter RhtA